MGLDFQPFTAAHALLIKSATLSAIMMVGAVMCPEGIIGILKKTKEMKRLLKLIKEREGNVANK